VQAASSLSAYNVDPSTVTKAGISSSGFMAVPSGYNANTGIPAAPTGLVVSDTTPNSVSLTRNASSGAASDNTYRNGSEVGSATSTSYADSGLSAKTSDTDAVIAVNPAGKSAQSSAVTATSPDTRSGAIPAPPTGLTVSSTTTSSVTLAWNASTGATRYDVYRSGTKVGSSASTSYTDDGLSPGTTYIYTVTAVFTNHIYTVTALNSSSESAEPQTVKAATQPQAVTAPLTLHYAEGRITGSQYRQLGQEYGHYTPFTLYLCGSTWTNSSTCGSLH
jgi:chitodextrinase